MRGIVLLILLCGLFACQPESKDQDIVQLERLQQELELQPSEERARNLLKGINGYISKHYKDEELIQPYLTQGADVAKEYGFLDMAPNYLLPLLRSKNASGDLLSRRLELGDVMININKQHASNIIYGQLLKTNPDNPEVQKRKVLIDSTALAQENYIQYLFDQLLVNPDEFGINRTSALKYVDAAEAFALVSPDHPQAADYLYKAAEVARSMRTMPKAMSIYDWILDSYPDYEKTPTVVFIKGFIMEQDFKKVEEAKEIYTMFLERYPDHQMASSAKFLLENLGKSEDEILKDIESRQKKQPVN